MPKWMYDLEVARITWVYDHPAVWWGAIGITVCCFAYLAYRSRQT